MSNEIEIATRFDPEDKSKWCEYGSEVEIEFIDNYCNKGISLPFKLNPNKKTNPMVRDLICTHPEHLDLLGDVKRQETPFYLAGKKFGVPPQFEMTSNLADHYYYTMDAESSGRETILLYWIKYITNKIEYGQTIYAMEGIWKGTKDEVIKKYHGLFISKKREDLPFDDKNKRVNFVLDLRDFKQLYLKDTVNNCSAISYL